MKRKWPNTKIVSIITNCAVCEKNTTKKNFEDGIFLCDECIKLSVAERENKKTEKLLDDYIEILHLLDDQDEE
jgi:epoxyqueuosine reductase QueG